MMKTHQQQFWILTWSVIVTVTVFLPYTTYAQPATKADIEQIAQKIDKLDQKVDNLKAYIDIRLDEMDKRLGGLIAANNTRIDDTNSKIDFFLTMLTIFFGGSLLGFAIWLFQTLKAGRAATTGLTSRQREEILELMRSVKT